MNPRLFFVGMVTAASAPIFVACAGTEFVLAAADASSGDGGADAALYDEPLIVRFDATSADREARAEAEAEADWSACDPTKSPHDDPCVVDDTLGAFVAPVANGGSDATGSGTKASPYATIGHAIASAAQKSRIYVCDAIYAEQVTLIRALSIYGGLSCPGGDAGTPWAFVGGLADVVSPSGDPALTVNAVAPAISIEDMGFTASNASGQDAIGNGKSSLAVFVKSSAVDFRRCAFSAGTGDKGSDGTMGANYTAGATTAPDGIANDGGVGGTGGKVLCKDGTSSTGGLGGNTNAVPPEGDGGAGTSIPAAPTSSTRSGAGGIGDDGIIGCGRGHNGADGLAGAAGTAASGLGTLGATGWTPSAGAAGGVGNPAQGGGGGGASAAPPLAGAGGGAGGCGGANGSAGKGGGASIALACVASSVALDACTLATANAGNGGKGGDGQMGQGGGTYGGAVGPCLGGYGGNGAGGGGGAGGTGGVSIDIVYQGTAPTGMRLYSTGNAGQPGAGGMGGRGGTNPIGTGVAGANGAAGLAGLATSIWQMQ